MTITLGRNIASLRGQRELAKTGNALEGVFQRLASGQRINKASDDAAGLAIADALNAQSRVSAQGIRNINDGISLLSIADSALEQLSNITVRLAELAEQSANGVYSSKQREAIDREAQSLSKEFSRIIQSTEFNDIKVLGSEVGNLRIQAGFGINGGIENGLGGNVGTGSFSDRISISTGSRPHSISTADFNNDGILDLVTSDWNADTVSVLLGDGSGNFNPRTSFDTGDRPRWVNTGDFNNDGIFDLVAVDTHSNTVSVFIGDGTGSFSERTSFDTGVRPYAVNTGDFNGDGVLDLITAEHDTNTASVFLGDGTGSFSERTSFDTGLRPHVVETGDFNNDGILDFITADRDSNTASVFLGDGTGSFNTRVSFDTGAKPSSLSVGDFNGDNILDFVTTDRDSSVVSVFIGDGTGSFSERTSYSTGPHPYGVKVGDFNGDNFLDFVTTDRDLNTANIFIGDGAGSFSESTSFTTGTDPYAVTTGDFNGDGVLDFVTADRIADTASVFIAETTSGTSHLLDFSLKTLADARQAIPIFNKKLEQLAAQRGEIGAFETRLNVAKNVLATNIENTKSAENQIRDVDVTVEAANLTKLRILQEASSAILAQANLQPSLVLNLLS